MKENEITYEIIGAALKVHIKLGPGLLESVYERALAFELQRAGHSVSCQIGIPVKYEEIKFEQDLSKRHRLTGCKNSL